MSNTGTSQTTSPALSADVVRIADAEQLRRVAAAGDVQVIVGSDDHLDAGARRVERVTAQAVQGRDRERIGLDLQSPKQFDRVASIVVTAEIDGAEVREFSAQWWAGGTPARPVLRIAGVGGPQVAADIASDMAAAYARAGMMERSGAAADRVLAFVTTHMVGRAEGAAALLRDPIEKLSGLPLGARFEIEIGQTGPRVRVMSPGIPTPDDAREIANLLTVARHYVEAGDGAARRNRTRDAGGLVVAGDSPRAVSWSLWDAVFSAARGSATERITNLAVDQLAHAAGQDYGVRVPAGPADAAGLMRWSDWAEVTGDGTVVTRTIDELIERIDRVREAMLVVAGALPPQ